MNHWERCTDGNGRYLLDLNSEKNEPTTARIDGGELTIDDAEQYYPFGRYSIPLADIDWLRERAARAISCRVALAWRPCWQRFQNNPKETPMLLMGKKPENWPLVVDPPCEMGDVVGVAAGIVSGWNYPCYIRLGADGKLWREDDRGWSTVVESELFAARVTKHDPSITPNGLMISRKYFDEYEADPDGYARRAQAEMDKEDERKSREGCFENITFIGTYDESGPKEPKSDLAYVNPDWKAD